MIRAAALLAIAIAAMAGEAPPPTQRAWPEAVPGDSVPVYDDNPGYAKALAASGPVRIAPWPGDRIAAFSLVFDDGTRDHYEVAAPMLDRVGLKGTFVVNPGRFVEDARAATAALLRLQEEQRREQRKPDLVIDRMQAPLTWTEVADLVKRGHEIGNHGMNHKSAGGADPDGDFYREEILGARELLERRLGIRVATYCNPYGEIDPKSPVGRFHLRSYVATTMRKRHGYTGGRDRDGTLRDAAWFDRRYDQATAKGGWIRTMIHGVGSGFEVVGADIFAAHLRHVASSSASVWVAPMGTVGRYYRQAATATVAAQVTGRRIAISLRCPLDPSIYSLPLTLIVSGVPAGASAMRAGSRLTLIRSADRVLVEAVPGPGEIIIAW